MERGSNEFAGKTFVLQNYISTSLKATKNEKDRATTKNIDSFK